MGARTPHIRTGVDTGHHSESRGIPDTKHENVSRYSYLGWDTAQPVGNLQTIQYQGEHRTEFHMKVGILHMKFVQMFIL